MNKATLLRLHRWVTFAFMVPIAALIVTGLVLSVEPIASYAAVEPGTLSAQRIVELLERHDPGSQARSLASRPYDGILLIAGVRPGPPLAVALGTGEEVSSKATWSEV